MAYMNAVRRFDFEAGRTRGSVTVQDALRFNEIEVAGDGTVWAIQTGTEESASWRVRPLGPGGDDGLVILDDGTKYFAGVRSRLPRPAP